MLRRALQDHPSSNVIANPYHQHLTLLSRLVKSGRTSWVLHRRKHWLLVTMANPVSRLVCYQKARVLIVIDLDALGLSDPQNSSPRSSFLSRQRKESQGPTPVPAVPQGEPSWPLRRGIQPRKPTEKLRYELYGHSP